MTLLHVAIGLDDASPVPTMLREQFWPFMRFIKAVVAEWSQTYVEMVQIAGGKVGYGKTLHPLHPSFDLGSMAISGQKTGCSRERDANQ